MDRRQLVTMKEASRALGAPPHRIIHLCESDVVRPELDAKGRGSVRRFSVDNLFVAAVALRLQDAGLTVKQLVLVRDAFDWLLRVRALKAEIDKGGLLGVVAYLRRGDHPVLLHVVMSEFLKGSRERDIQGDLGGSMVAIECGRRLPVPARPGIHFLTDDHNLLPIPLRMVVNLTRLRDEVLHALTLSQ